VIIGWIGRKAAGQSTFTVVEVKATQD